MPRPEPLPVPPALEGLLDARTAEAIGVHDLLAELHPVSEFGRRAREREGPFRPGDEERAAIALTRVLAAAQAYETERVAAIRTAIRAVPDVGAIAVRARFGEILTDVDLFEVDRFVRSVRDVVALVPGDLLRDRQVPSLAHLDERLAPGRLRAGSSTGFHIAERYDPDLPQARTVEASAQRRLESERERQTRSIEATLGRSIRREEFALVRETIPERLPAGVRVIRETPAYLLCTVEAGAEVLEAERLHEAALLELAVIEERVRAELSALVAAQANEIDGAAAALGTLDVFLARVQFAARHGGCVAALASGAPLALDAMTYVPLAQALAAARRRYVPISLDIVSVAIVRGPNMGGKSAALRAAGFAALCVALGVPPPARAASMPLFARIVWIGGEREDAFLSSFGDDVVRAQEVLRSRSGPALVLVDEFARTTSPRAGAALVAALVDALRDRDARALVATHFAAARGEDVQVLRVGGLPRGFTPPREAPLAATLAALGEAMEYRIVPDSGAGTDDDALRVAEALGLDPELLVHARTLLQKE